MIIYNIKDKTSKIIDDNIIPDGWTDKMPRWCNFEKFDEESKIWFIDENEELENYKQISKNIISEKSRKERISILDDQTILNILSGAISGYPVYLTKENISIMIEQFKTIAKTAKSNIKSATTKVEVDAVLNNLKFPTESEILSQVK